MMLSDFKVDSYFWADVTGGPRWKVVGFHGKKVIALNDYYYQVIFDQDDFLFCYKTKEKFLSERRPK